MRATSVGTETDRSQRLIEELEGFCLANPRYIGLFKSASNVAGRPFSQLRSMAGLVRREVGARFRRPLLPPSQSKSRVLVDAISGAPHIGLWLPIARDLVREGHSVCLAHMYARFEENIVKEAPELGDRTWYELVRVSEGSGPRSGWGRQRGRWKGGTLPWRGLFGAMVKMQMRCTDRLIGAFEEVLLACAARAVVTAHPLVEWSSALLAAARRVGVTSFWVQEGLPGIGIWRDQMCDYAIVWSELGKAALRRHGWPDEKVLIGRCPSIPDQDLMQEGRKVRRAALGVSAKEVCVLYLGQKGFDQAFEVKGYYETVHITAKGTAEACESMDLVPVFRGHPGESTGETLSIFESYRIPGLLVSCGSSLMDDVAAADVVVSMHSSAMEKAYLAGRPIVQVLATGVAPAADFSVLGAQCVETASELRDVLVGVDWIRTGDRRGTAHPSAGALIADRLSEAAGQRAR